VSDPRFKDRPLSGDVTPEQQRQLVRVMEEAAELSIAASKILRFGPANWHPDRPDETNTAALRRETTDLLEALKDLDEGPPDIESAAPAPFTLGDAPRAQAERNASEAAPGASVDAARLARIVGRHRLLSHSCSCGDRPSRQDIMKGEGTAVWYDGHVGDALLAALAAPEAPQASP
jgi:hypothetical protein